MIDWNRTEKETKKSKIYFDKYPGSNKKVCKICNDCGKVDWVVFNRSNLNLCRSCINKYAQIKRYQVPTPKLVSEQNRFIPGTGIDRIETIKRFGYDPIDLSEGSNKIVYCVCLQCGKIRNSFFNDSRILCKTCSNKSRIGVKFSEETRKKMSDNYGGSMTGKHHSEETKRKIGLWGKGRKHTNEAIQKMRDKQLGKPKSKESRIKSSCTKQGINIEDFTGFIGRHNDRDYVLSEELCIKLNIKFKGFNFHHIMSGVGIYIPIYLHRSICHNLKNGKGMNEINKLAINYLRGEL